MNLMNKDMKKEFAQWSEEYEVHMVAQRQKDEEMRKQLQEAADKLAAKSSLFDKYETILRVKGNTWIGGTVPCEEDKNALKQLEGMLLNPAVNPFLFAWYCKASKFAPKMTEKWSGPMYSLPEVAQEA